MEKTLAELKAENAQTETVEAPEPEILDEDEGIEDADQSEESTEEGEQTEEVLEAWEAEEKPDDSGKKFSDSDMAGLRKKLQSKLSEKDEQLERLRLEVESLKQGTQRPAQQAGTVPMPEDFDFDSGKYAAAMQSWVMSQVTNVTKATETQARQAQHAQTLQRQVDSHYERAEKLVKERAIDPDLYRTADESFRRTIESALPGMGDTVSEELIARLGEGSEKVTYYLGRNANERDILKAKLLEDPTGLAASMHLGKVLAKVSMPVQKTTRAPAPAARAEGGQSSASNQTLKRKYEKAKDLQDRIDIRREAKQAGIDVSKW